MTNGKIDAAQVEAILGGGQERVNRYLVTTLQQLITSSEQAPEVVATAVRTHERACRSQSRRAIYALVATCGTCIGLATPYVLRLLG